jgi:putative spermidine/putrescine transport system substrate-binding protein
MVRQRILEISSVCAALLVFSAAPASVQAADLTVGAFGGVWEQSLRKCAIAPFEKATGKKVDVVLGTPVQWLNQIAATPDKPPLDVIYNPTETSIDAVKRGLVDKFTPEKVPNMNELQTKFRDIAKGYGTVHNYGSMGLIYNKTTVKDPPKSWKEFYDGVLAGKWKGTVPNINYPSGGFTVGVWQVAETYGGSVENAQPGFDMLKKLAASGNMTFWSDPNQVLNALSSGDVDIAAYWDGRAWSFIDDGHADFAYTIPDPGAIVSMIWIQKVKNGSDLAWSFINTALSAEVQSCFGSAIRYGVANTKAKFDPAVAHQITPFSKLVFPPFDEVATQQAAWIEQWNKQVGR